MTEGGGWAGMEVHLLHLISGLHLNEDVAADVAVFSDGPLFDVLEAKGLEVEVIRRGRRFDIGVFWRVMKAIKSRDPDVVHMHGYFAVLLGVPAALLAGVKTRVVTLHASPTPAIGEGWRLRGSLWAMYVVMRCFGVRSIAVSRDVLESHVRERGLRRRDIRVVHNGIDEGISSVVGNASRTDLGLPEQGFLIGIVGRIDENKGHVYLLEALAQLEPERSALHVVVVGDGPRRQALQALCSTRGIEEYVRFLGFRSDVLKYVANLDTLVIASLHEGVPYVLLEAMALGVPVVATAVGGIPEVVQHSLSGLLVEPGNAGAIAASLDRISRDADLRARLSREASAVVKRGFSRHQMTEATVCAYTQWVTERDDGDQR